MVKRSTRRKSKRAKSEKIKSKISSRFDLLLRDISETDVRKLYDRYGPSSHSQKGGSQDEHLESISSAMMVLTLVIFALYHRNNQTVLDLYQVLLDNL